MEPIFDVSQKKLATRREQAENQLKERREKFEETLATIQAEIDAYREKELPRNVADIRKIVNQLEEVSKRVNESKEEANVSLYIST